MLLPVIHALALLGLAVSSASGVVTPTINGTLSRRAGTYTNPLNTAKGADPCMRYISGWYYLTSTQNSNIAMKRATTINGLKSAPLTTLFADSTAGRNFDFWAPEFWYLNGRWYIYYAVAGGGDDATHRMHVLQGGTDAANPMGGAYAYVGPLVPANRDTWAVDGTILTLNAVNYLVFSSFDGDDQCLWIVRMTSCVPHEVLLTSRRRERPSDRLLSPGTLCSSPGLRMLYVPSVLSSRVLSERCCQWEKVGLNVNEGPEVIQTGGVTRIVFSASYCTTFVSWRRCLR